MTAHRRAESSPSATPPGERPSHPLPGLIYRAQPLRAEEWSVCFLCRDPMLRRLDRVGSLPQICLLLPRRLIMRVMCSVSAGLNHADSGEED